MPSAAPPRIGARLREARVERSLSIEETAWRTRIRPELLRALEGDEFDSIGHHAFVKTHLASYARFLGVDPQAVVGDFESTVERSPSSLEELERAVKQARKPPRPKWVIAGAVSGALLIVAAVFGLLGGQAERPAADAAPSTAVNDELVAAPPEVTALNARVTVQLEMIEASQVTVFADGAIVFEGELERGATRRFRALEAVEVMVADGGAAHVRLNGEDLGVGGEPGIVFRARYGPNGPITD